MTYTIGDQEFRTKKDCFNRTKEMLKPLQGEIREGHPIFGYLRELIQFHPDYEEKVGVGLDYFSVKPNPLNPSSQHVDIVRKDGIVEGISIKTCCELNPKTKKNPENGLIEAMRSAVASDAGEFKNNSQLVCAECGATNGDFHTDHIYPFQAIKDDFLQATTLTIPTIFDKNYCNMKKFKESDAEFEKAWFEFHKQKRTYQILCASCNVKKSNSII